MLSVLLWRARRLIQPMLDELRTLTAARSGHNATMNVGAGVLGSRILQILEVMSAVVTPSIGKRYTIPAVGATPSQPVQHHLWGSPHRGKHLLFSLTGQHAHQSRREGKDAYGGSS